MNTLNPNQSFWIILLAFALYALLHSVLASLRLKAWAERSFGAAWLGRYYRFLFNVLGVITLLPIFWLMAVLPNRQLYTIATLWRWLMIAGQLFGLWVLVESVRQTGALDFLGLRQLASKEPTTAPDFTDTGMYGRVRHPLYSGAMLFLWLSPTMSINQAAFYLAISLYFWIGAIFEERKLARFYGEKYVDYQARTPIFVPRIFCSQCKRL